MRVLIVYGSAQGQTLKVSEFLADHLRKRAHTVELHDLARKAPTPDPGEFDAAIVAAPMRMGSFMPSVVRYVQRYRVALQMMPAAFVSVTLTAANPDPAMAERELDQRVAKFAEKTGWSPVYEHRAAGALTYTHYGMITRWLMKRIARDQGHPTDTSRDYEFTDWTALAAFADAFLAEAQKPMPSAMLDRMAA